MGRLGPGWLPTYVPACHRPWHFQHPSAIDNHRLMETCDSYESVFPNNSMTFEPNNTPWWTHWLIAFAVRKTSLDEHEICMLYKYKYRDVVPDLDGLQDKHVVADFWDYLRDGEHEYAFEWERSDEYQNALCDLMSAWLFEAYRMDSWRCEEERRHWLFNSYLNHAVVEEVPSDRVVGEAHDWSRGMEFPGQRKLG